jgi:hypothetical protein
MPEWPKGSACKAELHRFKSGFGLHNGP